MNDLAGRSQEAVHSLFTRLDESAPRNAWLVVNTKSRQGPEWFDQAQACLREYGVTLAAAHALRDPSKITDVVRAAMAQGAKLIIVGGGDGTFSSVVDLLAYTDVTLGVLPLGTVNDFARNLGIAPDVDAACRVIAEGQIAHVDLGQANDNFFTITASLGFSAEVQRGLTPGLKKRLGPLAYPAASLLALRRLHPIPITVQSEQGEERLEVVQAGVINGHYWMGGAVEIPNVTLESGRMAFYAAFPQSGWGIFRLARRLMRARFFHSSGLRAFTTREVTITTEKPQPLVVDGDLCDKTPVRLRVAPAALRVCVPKENKENQ